jgi:hypothetical protein
VKCKECKHLIKSEHISQMSKMIGYTSECSKTGILLKIDITHESPEWCPIKDK